MKRMLSKQKVVKQVMYSVSPYRLIGIIAFTVEKQQSASGSGSIKHQIPLYFWPRKAIKRHNPDLFARLTVHEHAK